MNNFSCFFSQGFTLPASGLFYSDTLTQVSFSLTADYPVLKHGEKGCTFEMPQENREQIHSLKHYCHAQTQLRPHVNVRGI